jgi:hypothetical protein
MLTLSAVECNPTTSTQRTPHVDRVSRQTDKAHTLCGGATSCTTLLSACGPSAQLTRNLPRPNQAAEHISHQFFMHKVRAGTLLARTSHSRGQHTAEKLDHLTEPYTAGASQLILVSYVVRRRNEEVRLRFAGESSAGKGVGIALPSITPALAHTMQNSPPASSRRLVEHAIVKEAIRSRYLCVKSTSLRPSSVHPFLMIHNGQSAVTKNSQSLSTLTSPLTSSTPAVPASLSSLILSLIRSNSASTAASPRHSRLASDT